MAETQTAKALRGAKFLDEKHPGWDKKIDLPTLDLNDCQECILGKLYGHYDKGLGQLFDGDFDHINRYRYGFSEVDPKNRMRKLTQVWGRLILARRRAVLDSLARLFS